MAAITLALPSVVWGDRMALKPGWNVFSPAQDAEVGQQAAVAAEKQLNLLNDPRVDAYVNEVGQRVAARAPGYKFQYSFRVVNDRAINAFALPGGHIYVNRGSIEAATRESELAGVIAHEVSHVALRHGTAQASKSSAARLPFALLGGLLGGKSGSTVAQLGAGLALNSLLLKYSRTDESQADIMGTQILYDSHYDPRGLSQFLETIQAQEKGGGSIEFFSNHPNPANRVGRVNEEVDLLGGSPRDAQISSRQFEDVRRYVLSLPPPPPKKQPSPTAQ